MGKIQDTNYILIQGWMVNELKLKGNELLVFAIIHGFSQDGENRFTGSLQYLVDWTSATKQGIMKNLKSLLDKGYIAKEEKYVNGVKFCEYYSTKFTGVCNTVAQGMQHSLTGGIKQSLPNNKDTDNKSNNNRITSILAEYNLSDPVREKVLEFINYRKQIKKPYKTDQGLRSMMKLVESKEQEYGSSAVMEVIDRSIQNEWQGLFFEKLDARKKPSKGKDLDSFYQMVDNFANG
jgi:hypothetical protein